MTHTEAFGRIIKANGTTRTYIAKSMGRASHTAVVHYLSSPGVRLDKVIEMADVLGYEVVLQPAQRAGGRKEGQYVLTAK